MRISKQRGKVVKLFIDGYQIEQVSPFCYLGSIITEDGRSEKEIICRIGMAKSKFYDNLKIFTGQLSTTTKKQMIKSLVRSVTLYATEAWTMRKVDTQILEAFEMWCWRKMFKISYKEHVTNDEVFSRAKEKRSIIARITKQQKLWIGHNLRHPDNLLTLAIEGRFIGKKGQGRKRCTFLDRLKSGEDYGILKRRAEDRDRWRNWKPA